MAVVLAVVPAPAATHQQVVVDTFVTNAPEAPTVIEFRIINWGTNALVSTQSRNLITP